MGGRLSWPLIEEGIARQAVLISSHRGLPEQNLQARRQRSEQNQKWAERFSRDPWNSILQDWNRQLVFQGSREEPVRAEKDFDRKKLAHMLTGFCLSHQKDYSSLSVRPHWHGLYLTGALDKVYSETAREWNGHSIEKIEIPEAGHRVILDQPAAEPGADWRTSQVFLDPVVSP